MSEINLVPAYPEICLLLSTLVILVIDMFLPSGRRIITFILSLLAIAACGAISLKLFVDYETTVYTFNNMFVSDSVSHIMKIATYGVMFMTLIYARRYIDERNMTRGLVGGEFYVLALFSLLGQMVIISGANFLVLYLGIELMSLPLYALVALKRDDVRVSEAAIKYFILGALGSGFMLYGISMIYGATASLDLRTVAELCASGNISRMVMVFGTVFVVAGMAFKLGVAPFHMWVPDVYDGAPTAVTLLIGGAPKIAAFAICLRILGEGLLPFAFDWQQMLIVLAILSMAIGNITALMQTSIKRMLAYSTIAQMGFMLLGLLSGVVNNNGFDSAANAWASSLFYAITYVLAFAGAFGIILILSHSGYEVDKLEDLRGLNRRNPWHAFVMMIFMLSLAGFPPLAGFYGKFSVIQAVVAADLIWLAVIAVILSVVGAFYYLRVIKLMYFDDPVIKNKTKVPGDMALTLGINMLAVVALGILPGYLMTLSQQAMIKLFTM